MQQVIPNFNLCVCVFKGRTGRWVILLPPPPCWFSVSNSETVKAVTPVFCSTQQLFIRDDPTKFDTPNSSQSLDIGQNSDRGIFDLRISGQSLINENCLNSRTSNDIIMKRESVTKL